MVGGPRAPAALMYIFSVVGIKESPWAPETAAQQPDLLVMGQAEVRPPPIRRALVPALVGRGACRSLGSCTSISLATGLSRTIGKVEQTRGAS